MTKIYTPLRAIRLKCLDCCGSQPKQVRLCPCEDCTLFPYRMGRRPKNTEETCKEKGGGAESV